MAKKVYVLREYRTLTEKQRKELIKNMARMGYQWVGIQRGKYIFEAEIEEDGQRGGIMHLE